MLSNNANIENKPVEDTIIEKRSLSNKKSYGNRNYSYEKLKVLEDAENRSRSKSFSNSKKVGGDKKKQMVGSFSLNNLQKSSYPNKPNIIKNKSMSGFFDFNYT